MIVLCIRTKSVVSWDDLSNDVLMIKFIRLFVVMLSLLLLREVSNPKLITMEFSIS